MHNTHNDYYTGEQDIVNVSADFSSEAEAEAEAAAAAAVAASSSRTVED